MKSGFNHRRHNLTGEALISEISKRTHHQFLNAERLERALTHSSARHGSCGGDDYERLEFLGDRVLGLVVAEMLFDDFPEADEGELSVRLNQLVNADACAQVAQEIGLHEFIITGTEIKNLNGRKQLNLRADVMESVIATVYLDGGLPAAQEFILRYWRNRAKAPSAARLDAKTQLQEWAHRFDSAVPEYKVLSRSGPDHDPIFHVSVKVKAFDAQDAKGRSKRGAEQSAAAELLKREGVWPENDEDTQTLSGEDN